MIETQQLTRYYGDFTAVDNVSFTIGTGEIVGLLGHNGAGKTTIMKMLTGYIEPSFGNVLIDDLSILEHRRDIQSNIGYLPENCPVYPEMTVIDYLEYVAHLRGITGPAARNAVRYGIRQTDLKAKATASISTLSRGYRQRVGVAQAILSQPKILVLDEPTNGLDPSQIQHMRELILGLGKQATVIISTHIMQEVQAICDRVLIIRNGRMALDSKLNELQKSQQLSLIIDSEPTVAQSKLANIFGVHSVKHQAIEGQYNHYLLELEDSQPSEEITANIAQAVISEGYKLYQLSPTTRDLETVFREINTDSSTGGKHRVA